MMFSKLKCSMKRCQISWMHGLIHGNKCFNSSFTTPVGIIGAPFRKGQKRLGVEFGPDALRNNGLLEQIKYLGIDVKDYGNLKFDYHIDKKIEIANPTVKNPLETGAACKKISDAVMNILLEGRKCVTIGGDHSIGIGTVTGHSLAHQVCVLWIDAHGDINTPATTLSGELHGLPLSFVVEELQKYQTPTPGFEWLKPCLKKENLALIGLRDIDPFEKLILNTENILHFTMRDIDKFGIVEVTKQALKAINPSGELSLHVSFDIDAIDPSVTGSTGTPVYGGLTVREVFSIAEEIYHLEYFRALDITEVNPCLGSREQVESTVNVATLVTKAFLGYSREGTPPPYVKEIPVL